MACCLPKVPACRGWPRLPCVGSILCCKQVLHRKGAAVFFTRRNFLQTSAWATTGLLISSEQALAQADAQPKPLPAPITRLKSRKSEATPISTAEREQRLEKARQLMAENKLDAIMLIGGTSLVYFTNIHWWLSERLFAFVLPVKGSAFYVCPAFEEERAREQIATGPGGNNPEIRLWEEDESPYQRVAEGLRDHGIASGRLGVEERVTFVFSDGVAKAAPALHVASATPVTAGCRMIKTQHELDLMTLANQVTLQAYEAAYRSLKEGMTQRDF